MINTKKHISRIKKGSAFAKSCVILLVAFLFLPFGLIQAQVISNNGAAVFVTPGIVIQAVEAGNDAGGIITNGGTINLTGSYISTATTTGNGLFNIGGDWKNSGGLLTGMGTVNFNGSVNQSIIRGGGETFYNLTINNTGASLGRRIIMTTNVNVSGTLSLFQGNVDASGFRLYLSNPDVAALNYASTTRSRILGRFERGINQAGTYLFPLGTTSYYNPVNLRTNGIPSPGSVLSQFITSPPPGNTGLPVPDPPVEVFKSYIDGYWRLTSDGFSSGDFSVDLTGNGFTDTIFDVTRVIKRTNGGDWIVDGSHADASDSTVYRNNLTGNISSLGTDFALARIRPFITDHPADTIVCENANPSFSVTATGTGPLTYIWFKDGVAITDGSHYNNSHRSSTLTIIGAVLADAGTYHVVVRDRDRNATTSNPATLVVNRIPVATVTPAIQDHECSGLPFDNIVIGESYGVPLTTFIWSRNNPEGITSTMDMTGSALVIGDILSGSFINTTDAPIQVTFTIIPSGQAPTYCLGLPVYATVTVNPTPRVISGEINLKPVICYDASTLIKLITPTTMTNGVIQFDYTVSTSGGDVIGNTAPLNNLPINHSIIFPYKNNSDTIQSVYYDIIPKNTISGCLPGSTVRTEVKIHPHPLQSEIVITKSLTCNGGSDASIHIDISKGTGPAYMIWYGPQGFERREGYGLTDFTGIPGGQYDVTVTDNLGCQSSATKSISGAIIDSRLYINPKPTGYGTTCPGSSDGEIWVRQNTSSTGTAPFTYYVMYNSTDTVIVDTLYSKGVYNRYYDLLPGNYKLYLKDANGCTDYYPREVNIVSPPEIKVEIEKRVFSGGYNVTCKGYDDGSVWVKDVSGGNGGYTYLWYTLDGVITGPDNTYRLDNIPAGTYYLITRDAYNCQKLDSVTLSEPPGMELQGTILSLSEDENFNISCYGGNNGSIDMTISGGSGDYTYSWTGPSGFTAETEDITGLKAGNYRCIVRDVNGCTLTPIPEYELTEPAPIVVQADISSSISGPYNINCFGGTASVDLTITGGSVGTYSFIWSTSNGSGIIEGQEDQNALSAGNYSVTVNDLNGCSLTREITITQPPVLNSILSASNISCQSGNFDDGSIDLSVSGGVAPYSFVWSNGATTEDLTGLTYGDYTITVTDANGCVTSGSATISLPPPLAYTKIVSDYSGFNINCYGRNTGFIRITPTGGTAPFIYTWTGPNGFTSNSSELSGLVAGDYNLTVTDNNFCFATETITLTEPGELGMIVTVSESIAGGFNISCKGDSSGSINLVPSNQVGYVSYFWSDGSSESNRINLTAGMYGIIMTDMNNCHVDTVITLTEPDSVHIIFEVIQPSCSDMPDGQINIEVTGGMSGAIYQYQWSDNSTGSSISNIVKGIYKVFVTDQNGCTFKDSIFIEPMNEVCLDIPNAISPNSDLINDVWNIGKKELYPEMEIRIMNRWGETVWRSAKGYPEPWDGRSNGSPLPVDSYHYIINLHNGTRPIIGNITIVR